MHIYDLFFWLIQAKFWNHLGLANPPLRPWAPLDEVVIVGGGVRCGCSWVSCCASPRDEEEEMSKGSIKQTIIPHCVHVFLLNILGHYGIQTIQIWKKNTFTCWMFFFQGELLTFSTTGFIANECSPQYLVLVNPNIFNRSYSSTYKPINP